MHTVILPVLGANMTHATVRAWLKQEGERVEVGDRLFEVETDKVDAEVEAEVAGVLRRIVVPAGTQVPILGIVAFVGEADEPVPPPETWSTLVPPTARAGRNARLPVSVDVDAPRPIGERSRTRISASPAARRLAREQGVALEQITGTGPRGEITRADVERAAANGGVSAVQHAASGDGRIDPALCELLRKDAASFRALSSDMKVHLYRLHGADIGERVRIEPGAIIIAREIHIGALSTIGADSTIDCDRLQLGRLVAFGKHTRAHCREITIGDALWSKDDVIIGGGGSDEAGARLTAGDACFFGEASYLNTCHPLTLGDEVCIGSRAMLFTHSHWQSILRGYPSVFGPIEIGDHVFIGNNAFIFPGVSIAAGATVMVNSFVALNVPASSLVGGVPAQVIRHIVEPDRATQIDIIRKRLPELAAHLEERGHQVAVRADTLELGRDTAVQFVPAWPAASAARRRTVVLTFIEGDAPQPPPGCTLMDLAGSRVLGVQDRLSDDVREFCRRRGIRFRPFAWRYGVGHFEGNRFIAR